MHNENKHNLFYFENDLMIGLYHDMEKWQQNNNKRFLSVSIQQDNGKFCCIALTNPSEVVIVARQSDGYDGYRGDYEEISRSWHDLSVTHV